MEFVVPPDHPSLPGHFPGHPIVPGVVILDRVLDAIDAVHGPSSTLRLPQVKFLRPLLPGETAVVQLDADPPPSPGATPLRWRFRVLRGDALLASGEIVSTPADALSVDARGVGALSEGGRAA